MQHSLGLGLHSLAFHYTDLHHVTAIRHSFTQIVSEVTVNIVQVLKTLMLMVEAMAPFTGPASLEIGTPFPESLITNFGVLNF